MYLLCELERRSRSRVDFRAQLETDCIDSWRDLGINLFVFGLGLVVQCQVSHLLTDGAVVRVIGTSVLLEFTNLQFQG